MWNRKFKRQTYLDLFVLKYGPVVVKAKASSALAYLYERDGRFYAACFGGKRNEPDRHYTYKTADRRAEAVREHFEAVQRQEQARAERRAERYAFEHTLKVGDILSASWGYDQTNVDFYQVTRVVSKKSVEIAAIWAKKGTADKDAHFTATYVAPDKDNFKTGKWNYSNNDKDRAVKRVSAGNCINIDGTRYATPYTAGEKGEYQTASGFGH